MKNKFGNRLGALVPLVALCAGIHSAEARECEAHQFVLTDLNAPTAIAIDAYGKLYYSEVPQPGTSGEVDGVSNTVSRYSARSNHSKVLSAGEPYPLNIALDRQHNVYWTCNTVGVILKYNQRKQEKGVFLPNGFMPGSSDPADFDFLLSPSGISVDKNGDVLFTEVPMPGTPGFNLVSVSDGENISLISDGEPEPTDIVIGWDGTAYWTCKSAGVILKRSPAGVISLLKNGLEAPTGIALDRFGKRLYYTEVPTPNVADFDLVNAQRNRVVELDLKTMETTLVSEGFPYPQDVAVSTNGTVYWTCKTAGVIASAAPKKEKKSRYYRWWGGRW